MTLSSDFTAEIFQALWLTVKLATVTTAILFIIGTPLALWLAGSRRWYKGVISTIVAMPLVLPPTVLGFYFLLLLGPSGPVGSITQALGLGTLAFTFEGLVVASVFYSLPFVVQPLQNAIAAIDPHYYAIGATLKASSVDRFLSITLPLAKSGFITAAILGFAHTVGEFGVVLMIGGNIPEETRVASVLIYDQVETLNYQNAHLLSAILVVFSFLVLFLLYISGQNRGQLFVAHKERSND